MKNISLSSYDLRWLSLTVIVLVTLSFLFTVQPQDYWWCLRVGRDTLSSGAVPVTENLSWSQAGHPIIYQPWLACVGFWLAYDLGGAPLTYLLRGVLISLAYGLLWCMAKQESGLHLATLLVLVMGFATSNNWQMRTQLFAYPLFAFFYIVFSNGRKEATNSFGACRSQQFFGQTCTAPLSCRLS